LLYGLLYTKRRWVEVTDVDRHRLYRAPRRRAMDSDDKPLMQQIFEKLERDGKLVKTGRMRNGAAGTG
jgi:hypothetical protein